MLRKKLTGPGNQICISHCWIDSIRLQRTQASDITAAAVMIGVIKSLEMSGIFQPTNKVSSQLHRRSFSGVKNRPKNPTCRSVRFLVALSLVAERQKTANFFPVLYFFLYLGLSGESFLARPRQERLKTTTTVGQDKTREENRWSGCCCC